MQRRDRLAAALDEPFEEADGPREHRHAQHLAQRVAILVEQVGDVQAEARILGGLEQKLRRQVAEWAEAAGLDEDDGVAVLDGFGEALARLGNLVASVVAASRRYSRSQPPTGETSSARVGFREDAFDGSGTPAEKLTRRSKGAGRALVDCIVRGVSSWMAT